ncbi:MAG: hypothetical protein WC600_03595, partial [Desulfobaccales bacterium]
KIAGHYGIAEFSLYEHRLESLCYRGIFKYPYKVSAAKKLLQETLLANAIAIRCQLSVISKSR